MNTSINHSTQKEYTTIIRADQSYDCLMETNRNILRRYALLALCDREMVSPRVVTEEDVIKFSQFEKTYTVVIYPDDVNNRYGYQVMFANESEVTALVKFLEEKVGPARMGIFRRSIKGDPCDVEVIAQNWYNGWKTRVEKWPLENVG